MDMRAFLLVLPERLREIVSSNLPFPLNRRQIVVLVGSSRRAYRLILTIRTPFKTRVK